MSEFGVYHNWPGRPKRERYSLFPKRQSTLSYKELDLRIRELHQVRHRLLDIALKRNLTHGEVRLAKHILRELDWYGLRFAWPEWEAGRIRMEVLREFAKRVKKFAERVSRNKK